MVVLKYTILSIIIGDQMPTKHPIDTMTLGLLELPKNGLLFLLLTAALVLGVGITTWAVDPLSYPYLFRKKIRSSSGKYELKSVLYGRLYQVQYFFLPSTKQYLVYSNVGTPAVFDDPIPFKRKEYTSVHVLLDETGSEVRRFETHERLSCKSGVFYSPTGYCDWLSTGDTTFRDYDLVLNKDLKMDQKTFNDTFKSEYKTATYCEIAYLRTSANEKYEAAIVFRSGNQVKALLAGISDSMLYGEYVEDPRTNGWEQVYSLRMSNAQEYPLSKPSLPMVRLETNNTYPFKFVRKPFSSPFQIKKYHKQYAAGWNGIATIKGIPIYVPGEVSGVSFVKARIDGETFRFRVQGVEKFLFYYNLGLRTFQVPQAYRTEQSLTLMESVQNGGDDRIGGGTLVMRKVDAQSCADDLPADISEKRFDQLPIQLQEALMFPTQAVSLEIPGKMPVWFPEIGLLTQLKRLTIHTTMKSMPDEIAQLTHLESLTIEGGDLEEVSPKLSRLKHLKHLNLFSNKIAIFPEEVVAIPTLETLTLSANESLASIPASIVQLTRLKRLEIGMTAIRTLPEEMAEMHQLYIWDTADMAKRLPEKFQHLFDVYKRIDD